jgi:ribosomal protein L37E
MHLWVVCYIIHCLLYRKSWHVFLSGVLSGEVMVWSDWSWSQRWWNIDFTDNPIHEYDTTGRGNIALRGREDFNFLRFSTVTHLFQSQKLSPVLSKSGLSNLIGDSKCNVLYKTQEWNSLVFYFRGPPLWSSGQNSWLQIRRPGFDSRHYQKKKSSGSGTGSTQPREYNWGATC